MFRFDSDYTEGAHPQILRRLTETNYEQTSGYGTDIYCERAAKRIRAACGREDAAIHFLIGGTQTNVILIDAALRPYQGVIAAQSGHINVHETGAVEGTGHKILTLPSEDGKITADAVAALCASHFDDAAPEHMVQPGMVYLSQPTENGTLYKKAELTDLRRVCDRYGLYLYVDGARLGYALASPANDVTLPDLCALCDAFYIGGTKVGALFGEALVILQPAIAKYFRYFVKHRAGMLAKGRLLGIQFDVLFENQLYTAIAAGAVRSALKIRAALEARNIPLLYDSPTNQQFPVFTKEQLEILSRKYVFSDWGAVDDDSLAVRICTSWATSPRAVADLARDIAGLP